MEEIDLKELINIFMEKKMLIVLIVVIFALLGAIYTLKFITPMYEATTSLVLVQIGGDLKDGTTSITTTDIQLNSKLVNDYSSIAGSEVVAQKVLENLKLPMTLSELRECISITTETNTEVISIIVKHSDPEIAQRIANEVASVFMEKTQEIYKVGNIYVLDKASLPITPYNIHLSKNIIVFAFIGGVLVSGYILLINMLDTTIKSDSDIEKTLDVPVLASIIYKDENTKRRSKSYGKTPDMLSAKATKNYLDKRANGIVNADREDEVETPVDNITSIDSEIDYYQNMYSSQRVINRRKK